MGGFHVIGINFKFILIYIFEEELIISCIFVTFGKEFFGVVQNVSIISSCVKWSPARG